MFSHLVLLWFICAFVGRNVLQGKDIYYHHNLGSAGGPESRVQCFIGDAAVTQHHTLISFHTRVADHWGRLREASTWASFTFLSLEMNQNPRASLSAAFRFIWMLKRCYIDVETMREEIPRVRHEGGNWRGEEEDGYKIGMKVVVRLERSLLGHRKWSSVEVNGLLTHRGRRRATCVYALSFWWMLFYWCGS